MKQTLFEKIHKTIAVLVVGLMLFGNVSFALADDAPVDSSTPPAETQSVEQQPPVDQGTTSTQAAADVTPSPTVEVTPILTVTPIPMPSMPVNPADELKTKSAQQVIDEIRAKNTEKRAQAKAADDATRAAAKEKAGKAPAPSGSAIVPTTNSGPTIADASVGAVVNSGNGQGSTNTGASTSNNTNNTSQNNSANVNTSLNQSAKTGSNTAHDNIGGDTTVKSGDANVSGTAITGVNSNLDNVAVSEFNVNDVQNGDLVLNSASHCISGCGTSSPNVVINKNNGQDSNNSADSTTNNTENTFQNNDANVGTDMNLSADSGHNRAHDNIDGDTSVESGNANVSANALTLANNNIDGGKVQYNVVNIYGELHGDIVLPEEEVANPSATMNSGNGANSKNTASNSTNNSDTTAQNNNANITNNLNIDTATGGNYASDNGGGADVSSGNTKVDANVLNVANSNIDGQTMWLVIVNQAGKWVGKILGGDGSNMAGSDGTEFIVNDDGTVTASNQGNGEGSTNDASNTTNNTSTTTQDNNANITNNLNLSANTGDNRSHDNLGVKSGDATIIANIINFVNNNITGNGKLVVTVVNVFGQWFGDFVAPGQTKQSNVAQAAVQNNSNNNSNSNDNSANNSSGNQTQTEVLGVKTAGSIAQSGGTSYALGNKSNGSANVLVAGVSNLSNNSQMKNTLTNNMHQISVNLAWMFVFLPILALGIVGRKFLKRNIAAK